jgi:8-oxo-dGTP pyrophosphatase MutT (NUDIX family)
MYLTKHNHKYERNRQIAFIEIQKRKILSTKSRKTKYYIPGGKRENGESDEQTLIREIAEELSVAISQIRLNI